MTEEKSCLQIGPIYLDKSLMATWKPDQTGLQVNI